jgi:hypothetical protein
VKSLARQAFFFSLSFMTVFLAASAIRYLHIWIDAARLVPAGTLEVFASLILAGRWALPVTLYVSVLLTLSYSARKAFSLPLSILCVFVLSCVFTAGLSLGLRHADASVVLPGTARPPVLGGPGLILTQGETAVVLLEGPLNPEGSRVIAIPGRPLIYRKTPAGPVNAGVTLPSLPFRVGRPYFITSLFIDFSLAAGQFRDRLNEGFIPFGIYLGALCFLLSSLRFVVNLTSWPLANVFLGALVFRGILAAGTFLDSAEIQQFILLFLKADIPQALITPVILCGLAVLVILYTALVNLARGRRASG